MPAATPHQLDLTDTVHARGTTMQLPSPLTRALAWSVAATLLERHDDLVVVELHPGGGQYDCLSVYERPNTLICHLNITGSLTHRSWFEHGGERITWLEVLERGPRWAAELIEEVEDVLPPAKASSPEAVTARACAHIASLFALRGDVELLSAVADGPYGAGLRSDLLQPFTTECTNLGLEPVVVGEGAYRWWFVTRRGPDGTCAIACLDAQTAQIWFGPGTTGAALDTLSTADLTGRVAGLL